MAELTPLEKVQMIAPGGTGDTPIELLRSALVQHFKDDTEQFNAMHDLLIEISHKLDPRHDDYINKGIEETLKPISETYTSVSTMGKWIMAVLVAVSLIVGIIYAAVEVWRAR